MNHPNKKTPHWVGNIITRLCFAMLFLAGLFAIHTHHARTLADQPVIPTFLMVLLGISTFISLIFSFRKLYAAWMRFGEFLNRCVTTLLFSVIYFSLLPLFRLWTFVKSIFTNNSTKSVSSFWIVRPEKPIDLDFFKRMG